MRLELILGSWKKSRDAIVGHPSTSFPRRIGLVQGVTSCQTIQCVFDSMWRTFNEISLQKREVPVHAMKAYRGEVRGIVPLILNLTEASGHLHVSTGLDPRK